MKEGVLKIQDETFSISESMVEHDKANRAVLSQLTQTRDLANNLNGNRRCYYRSESGDDR